MNVKPFYRPSSKGGVLQEDGYAVNETAGLYLVADGVSGAYSPSNPPLLYSKNGQKMSGGRMVSFLIEETIKAAQPGSDLCSVLVAANNEVLRRHYEMSKDPFKEAVAGACVAACQVKENDILFVAGGDSWVFWKDDIGAHCLSNFDQAAFEFEERGDQKFQECLNSPMAGGNIGKAWDLYFDYFSEKQLFRANKNRGKGGHAMLNGDPSFPHYLERIVVPQSSVQWIVLCTDGLLPKPMTDPRDQERLVTEFDKHYERGGISEVVVWRDSFPNEPHIGQGWPESTVLEILLN